MNAPHRSNASSAVRIEELGRELARIAKTLTRLANAPDQVALPAVATPVSPVRLNNADQAYRDRRRRDAIFSGYDLFGEPAWDILLDLRVHQSRRDVCVSSACIAAAVPATTALRYVQALEAHGLIEAKADPFDKRLRVLSLSPIGTELMERYFGATR